jgi:hypothetical protein
VDPDHALGMGMAEARRDERAPVAALRGKALVPEDGHQVGQALDDRLQREARLTRRERQAIAGQRGRHDRERIGRITAEARRIGQARDQLEEFEHRARPAVRQQEWHGIGSFARDVQEVHVDAVQRRLVLGEGVEPRLLCAPVEVPLPVVDQLLHVPDVAAVGPRRPRRLVRETGAREALAQIGDRGIRHVQRERFGLPAHDVSPRDAAGGSVGACCDLE